MLSGGEPTLHPHLLEILEGRWRGQWGAS